MCIISLYYDVENTYNLVTSGPELSNSNVTKVRLNKHKHFIMILYATNLEKARPGSSRGPRLLETVAITGETWTDLPHTASNTDTGVPVDLLLYCNFTSGEASHHVRSISRPNQLRSSLSTFGAGLLPPRFLIRQLPHLP